MQTASRMATARVAARLSSPRRHKGKTEGVLWREHFLEGALRREPGHWLGSGSAADQRVNGAM